MNGSAGVSQQGPRFLNSVPLENAVLCAECDVVSDSPHDTCLVCGGRSLFNIARIFGGELPKERADVITQEVIEVRSSDVVLSQSLTGCEGGRQLDLDTSQSSRSTIMRVMR
jgi:hypothetical protein